MASIERYSPLLFLWILTPLLISLQSVAGNDGIGSHYIAPLWLLVVAPTTAPLHNDTAPHRHLHNTQTPHHTSDKSFA
jgi:hypothetical protein